MPAGDRSSPRMTKATLNPVHATSRTADRCAWQATLRMVSGRWVLGWVLVSYGRHRHELARGDTGTGGVADEPALSGTRRHGPLLIRRRGAAGQQARTLHHIPCSPCRGYPRPRRARTAAQVSPGRRCQTADRTHAATQPSPTSPCYAASGASRPPPAPHPTAITKPTNAAHCGPSVAVRGKPTVPADRADRPIAVRYVSVDSATWRSAPPRDDTRRDKAKRPAVPGNPSSRAVFAGDGRCWVRTNVG
jgi:hypothetical protein